MMTRQLIILSLVFVLSALAVLPSRASAQAPGLPFGGLVSFSIPCTCSGGLWVWFTPLYLGGPAVLSGPMVYSPYVTMLYPYYMIGVPGTWHLGSYVPAAPACWVVPPPPAAGCVPLPATGVMTRVGTNRLF